MKALAPNTPVIVGVGFAQERIEDPLESSEACRLMADAVRAAAGDAGSADLLEHVESISVPQGLWEYRNPGKLIADELGCAKARSILADLGVLQLTLLSDLCRAIAAGEQQLGVVAAGEAKYRELRSKITGQAVSDTEQGDDTPEPDVHHLLPDPFCADLEGRRGLWSPVEFFAIIESALRYRQGLGVEEHRDKIAGLYSAFSEIAAANPHAWRRRAVAAEEIRGGSAKNPMIAFPYTKLHCSQWNVNQAVAILLCSAAKAEQLGLDSGSWIYPLSAAECKHVVPLAQQRVLYSHPGTVLSGERALALAGVSAAELTAVELYSCFPAAIQSFALDLKLAADCPLTVTGAMPFAGGPFNHFSLDGVARMVEVLREGRAADASARRVGLVTNLSGIFGKQGCAVFSSRPSESGYAFEDLTAAVTATDTPLPLTGDYAGSATVVGYTVVFGKDAPMHAIAVCDTSAGERTVVRSQDPALLEAMTREEFCGRVVRVSREGSFSLEG